MGTGNYGLFLRCLLQKACDKRVIVKTVLGIAFAVHACRRDFTAGIRYNKRNILFENCLHLGKFPHRVRADYKLAYDAGKKQRRTDIFFLCYPVIRIIMAWQPERNCFDSTSPGSVGKSLWGAENVSQRYQRVSPSRKARASSRSRRRVHAPACGSPSQRRAPRLRLRLNRQPGA